MATFANACLNKFSRRCSRIPSFRLLSLPPSVVVVVTVLCTRSCDNLFSSWSWRVILSRFFFVFSLLLRSDLPTALSSLLVKVVLLRLLAASVVLLFSSSSSCDGGCQSSSHEIPVDVSTSTLGSFCLVLRTLPMPQLEGDGCADGPVPSSSTSSSSSSSPSFSSSSNRLSPSLYPFFWCQYRRSSRSNQARLAHANDNDLPVPVGDSHAKILVVELVPVLELVVGELELVVTDTTGDVCGDGGGGIPSVMVDINACCCEYGPLGYGNSSKNVGVEEGLHRLEL
mmetsp:Transcript_117/g.190  ORF Transcript_117/g.190 Transcript_117/m.190 type:complete len:284 (+) Transcript_117:543-1394(+)